MNTVDWNWFFSSAAQSAAAIVGIFGAFIVTKILANQATFSERQRRMQELMTSGQKIAEAAARLSFEWYHRHKNEDAVADVNKILEDGGSLDSEDIYDKVRFSPYIARADAVALIDRARSQRDARIEKEREDAQALASLSSILARSHTLFDSVAPRTPLLSTAHFLEPKLSAEREDMDTLFSDARHHIRVVSEVLKSASANPESSGVITAALILIMALFFAGVVYPLSFMPLRLNWVPDLAFSEFWNTLFSLQGAVLSVISALFSAMIGMFFFMNIRLKCASKTLADLASYKEMATYSQYFANREQNSDQRASARTVAPAIPVEAL
ncbi:hypothetical protein [Dyella japonica]|uniref:Uncharacterized protein n=1 Tax=Dyella japonica DSM 16301 TaxID=1440762 RepID=A0A0G9H873_9GAMM|nr:hypothetical protein [Dyella japonica]KLD63907.1 hypothetical protein Y882_09825 [Dyella japonica DSM 16301]